jgi:HK97 family phage prohead protease
MKNEKETRQFNAPELRAETDEAGNTVLTGYAAVFGELSEDLGGFKEIIHRNAFDNVLNDDVVFLLNHDNNIVFGRSSSGTLKLSVDERGLKTEVKMPNTGPANDAVELMKRGDLSKMSFGFFIESDKWKESERGFIREVTEVKRLTDVSLVTRPAYPQTSASIRSLEEFKYECRDNVQARKNKLRILKLKK